MLRLEDPVRLVTLQAEDAHAAATRDREAAADRILCAAVDVAVLLVAEGRPGRATYVMTRACMSADRILGRVGGA